MDTKKNILWIAYLYVFAGSKNLLLSNVESFFGLLLATRTNLKSEKATLLSVRFD